MAARDHAPACGDDGDGCSGVEIAGSCRCPRPVPNTVRYVPRYAATVASKRVIAFSFIAVAAAKSPTNTALGRRANSTLFRRRQSKNRNARDAREGSAEAGVQTLLAIAAEFFSTSSAVHEKEEGNGGGGGLFLDAVPCATAKEEKEEESEGAVSGISPPRL